MSPECSNLDGSNHVNVCIVPAAGRLSECSTACGFPHVRHSVSDGTSGEKAGDLEVLGYFQQLKLL